MEYLGGGSCLDLVSTELLLLIVVHHEGWHLLIYIPAQTWQFFRAPDRRHLPGTAARA